MAMKSSKGACPHCGAATLRCIEVQWEAYACRTCGAVLDRTGEDFEFDGTSADLKFLRELFRIPLKRVANSKPPMPSPLDEVLE